MLCVYQSLDVNKDKIVIYKKLWHRKKLGERSGGWEWEWEWEWEWGVGVGWEWKGEGRK
jgi:hypothetical protein